MQSKSNAPSLPFHTKKFKTCLSRCSGHQKTFPHTICVYSEWSHPFLLFVWCQNSQSKPHTLQIPVYSGGNDNEDGKDNCDWTCLYFNLQGI